MVVYCSCNHPDRNPDVCSLAHGQRGTRQTIWIQDQEKFTSTQVRLPHRRLRMVTGMIQTVTINTKWTRLIIISMCLLGLALLASPASALTPIPPPDPKPGSFGVEATKTQPPPTQPARITTPGNGASFSESPIRVSGICPTGLLVQVYNNDVMVGAVMCNNGSFSLEVSLFAGTNELSAIVYDDLEQAGPRSNIATVEYSNTNFTAFGELVTLTSSYGRRSAAAGTQLSWPLQLSGGTGPYAF